MYFIPKRGSWGCLAHLADFLPHCLGLHAGVTHKGGPIVYELDAFNGTVFDHFPDGIRGNVSQASVQRCQVNVLFRGCRDKRPLDLVEAILADWDDADDLVRLVLDLANVVLEGDRIAGLRDAVD